jgi:YegS/Rv2252/BmrU family lipid kinase
VRSLCLILNPAAGGGRASRAMPGVEAALRDLGATFRTVRTTGLTHAGELAREAAAFGEVAVSVGGDGLAGSVAHALRTSGGVMGVLPGGRGNDFVRTLGISTDPEKACATLVHGRERTVDVGEVDGRTFLGIASYGLDSDVQEVALEARLVRGQLVYVYATLRSLAAWRHAGFTYSADGGPPQRFTGYALAACNSGRFGGGMRLAPDASLEDGLLDVVVQRSAPKLKYLRNVERVFKGTHVHEPDVEILRARELRVDADRTFQIWADGDPIGHTPATIRAVHGGLRVVAP